MGEVGYELHFPAAHGEHLWDALLEAGAQHGLRPFGLEPQRLLRLQKMHILVGQDTDSESTPFGAAMPWIVKLDKEQDFIGKWALERAAGEDLPRPRSWASRWPTATCRPRARWCCPDGDGPVGQVTSARLSPQLGGVIGMALGAGRAGQGRRARSRSPTRASGSRPTVVTRPFYDPDGEVLRS